MPTAAGGWMPTAAAAGGGGDIPTARPAEAIRVTQKRTTDAATRGIGSRQQKLRPVRAGEGQGVLFTYFLKISSNPFCVDQSCFRDTALGTFFGVFARYID